MSFNAPYVFGISNHIVMKHAGGKYIRVSPNNTTHCDPNGGTGIFAQWHVEKVNNTFKFKSAKTGRYLRILQNGGIDAQGSGGPWTVFNAHGTGNIRKLESVKVPGKYIAVRNGQVVFGTGGPFCAITFYRKGQQQQQNFQQNYQQQTFQQNFQQPMQTKTVVITKTITQTKQPFSAPYVFGKTNNVVIKHGGGKFLRINPNKRKEADAHGGKGPLAQWVCEKHMNHFKFKNIASGKYLRISKKGHVDVDGNGGKWTLFKAHGNGNIRKLESVQLFGKYVAVRDGYICIGTGGPFCAFTFYRN